MTYVLSLHNTKLRWRCKKGHEWEAAPYSIKSGRWCPYCAGVGKLTIEEMQEIATQRGGECLSEKYINALTKLKWRCKEGHEWETTPNIIKNRGCWCPYCARKPKLTIKDMQKLAESRGGECLSTRYVDNSTKLRWRCKDGHEWEARPSNVKSGSWCPYCVGLAKLTIEEMQKLAKSKGGKCLSKRYINVITKLRWRCKDGHEWEAMPTSIRNGGWCPYCAGVVKLTIEEMKRVAKERGGKCLSKEYINTRTKLRWRCKKGHAWEASPQNIKSGTWCPYCAGKKSSF